MKSSQPVFVALLGVLCCTPAVAAKKAKTLDVRVRADITVDATGHISALKWVDEQPVRKLIAQTIASRVQTWEFEPAKVNGKPSEAETSLNISTRLTQQEDGSASIEVTDAHTGPRVDMAPPKFPLDAAMEGVDAIVTLDLEIGPDGKAVITKSEFDGSNGASHRAAFLKATQVAVSNWIFHPEIVAGRAMPTHMQVPVTFCISGAGRWCKSLRNKTQTLDPPADMPIALDSAVVFKTDFRTPSIP